MKVNQFHLFDVDQQQKNQFLPPSPKTNKKALKLQQSQNKSKEYLKALQQQNKYLLNKIKNYDQKLKNQLQKINKKIVSPSKKRVVVPKFDEMQSQQLRNKFQQFQKLKRQMHAVKEGNQSLQFLQNMKIQQENKLKYIKQQIKTYKIKIQNLKRIQKKSQYQEKKSKQFINNLGQYNFYDSEISMLKQQVKKKKDNLLLQRKTQLQAITKSRANKSTNNIVTLQPQIQKQQLPAQVLQIKKQYQTLGKKIDLLKLKKHNLQKSLKQSSSLKTDLQKIKYKYQNLIKTKK